MTAFGFTPAAVAARTPTTPGEAVVVGVIFGLVGVVCLVFHRPLFAFYDELMQDRYPGIIIVSVYVVPIVFAMFGLFMVVRGASSL